MFLRAFGFILATSTLSACVVVDRDVTTSGFGLAPAGLNNVQTESASNAFGTVNLRSGTNADGAAAYASLVQSAIGSPLPVTDVTYTGAYEVIGIRDIRNIIDLTGPDYISGTNFSDSGTVSLTADMSANTLTGTDGTLFVLGTLSGSNISGSVTYDGQSGALDGALYEEGGIAAFHGNDDTRVFSGGLTMVETP